MVQVESQAQLRSPTEQPLLRVSDLRVDFRQRGRRSDLLHAVDGVSFSVVRGETVGLVGESGSGKTTIGRAILGLLRSVGGTIELDGKDVTGHAAGKPAWAAQMMQAVFQDPIGSLNPARTIGRTLAEPLEVQQKLRGEQARAEVERLLRSVGLPEDAANRYPHGFSGGQRQRIGIARGLAPAPRLLICDEAVSALDLVTRAQVINLLVRLQQERGLAMLFIAHDLTVVTHISHRTVVLYGGRVMEQGPAELVDGRPLHPYTRALQAAVPSPVPALQRERRELRKAVVATSTANAKPTPAEGCPFAPRCPYVAEVCWSQRPADTIVGPVTVACHRYSPGSGHPDQASPDGLKELGTTAPTVRSLTA